MKKKIFAYFLVVTIIGVSVTGLLISLLSQQYYKDEAEEKLAHAARLIKHDISEELSEGKIIDYNQAAKKYADILNEGIYLDPSMTSIKNRVSFIDIYGYVAGESDADFREMENHLNRQEITQAISGQLGTDIRYSSTLKTKFLYTALLIEQADIVVRVSHPLNYISNINKTTLKFSLIGIFAGIAITIFLANRFSARVSHPIDQKINAVNQQLEKTIEELTDKNVKVDSIINSMMNGIVAVDRDYHVMLINSKACELFGINQKDEVFGANLLEFIRNNRINRMLTDTIESNESMSAEVHLNSPHDMILQVKTAPIMPKDSSSPNSGGIIYVEDITAFKKLEHIRTEFVSNVTHELKTPLTSIRGFVETLKNGALDDKEIANQFIDIIDIEAERLSTLINDILQLSEIESGMKDSNIAVHKLDSIITEIKPVLQSVAEKKNISLSWNVDENLHIKANKDRIKQLFINIIDNAIKYNIDNGNVDITAIKKDGKINISVKDTGIGIESRHLSRIFERFYRIDKGRSRNMGGTGLGLSIVKHIVNLYGGDLNVKSSPGNGTEFIIRFPL